jgi:hypothetical protein
MEVWAHEQVSTALDFWHIVFSKEQNPELLEAEDMFHVGRVKTDALASGRGCVHANDSDPQEFIVRGPYRFLKKGKYILRARLKATAKPGSTPSAQFDICSALSPVSKNRNLLKTYKYNPQMNDEYSTVDIPFAVTGPGAVVECNIHRLANTELFLDWLKIISSP